MPLHLGAFVLSNSKNIMNNFIHAINGFYTNDVYYSDTDSLYIENKHWNKLDKAKLIGRKLIQGKNDYGLNSGIFYGLFLAPKTKCCLTIIKYGVIYEHKTFKVFTNVSDNLDKEYFKMFNGDKIIAEVPLSWKKPFSQGVVIPQKKRNCNKCVRDILSVGCDKIVNQNEEISANLNEIKRQAPNEFCQMLPKYITL